MKEENPFEKRSCYDCGNMRSAISWWCVSKEAQEYRGTSIPGTYHCDFWKPDWSYIDKLYKTDVYGYKKTFFEKVVSFVIGG